MLLKMLKDMILVLLVSLLIEYEYSDLDDICVMVVVVSLKSLQMLSGIRGLKLF